MKLRHLFATAVLALSLSGRVWAGIEAPGPNDNAAEGPTSMSDSQLAAWSPSDNAAASYDVAALQNYLNSGLGQEALAMNPTLNVIKRLDPKSEAHRRIVGMLHLPHNFTTVLAVARMEAKAGRSDTDMQKAALKVILYSARSQNFQDKIIDAVEERSDQVIAAVSSRHMSPAQLEAASSELSPFIFFSPKAVHALQDVAQAQGKQAMVDAQNTADAFAALSKGADNGAATLGAEQSGDASAEVTHLLPGTNNSERPREMMSGTATMQKLLDGYNATYGDSVEPQTFQQAADAAALKQFDSRKYTAYGYLSATLTRHPDRSGDVDLYLRMEQDGGQVLIRQEHFPILRQAYGYINAQPLGEFVAFKFTVDAFRKSTRGTPFILDEKIAPAAGMTPRPLIYDENGKPNGNIGLGGKVVLYVRDAADESAAQVFNSKENTPAAVREKAIRFGIIAAVIALLGGALGASVYSWISSGFVAGASVFGQSLIVLTSLFWAAKGGTYAAGIIGFNINPVVAEFLGVPSDRADYGHQDAESAKDSQSAAPPMLDVIAMKTFDPKQFNGKEFAARGLLEVMTNDTLVRYYLQAENSWHDVLINLESYPTESAAQQVKDSFADKAQEPVIASFKVNRYGLPPFVVEKIVSANDGTVIWQRGPSAAAKFLAGLKALY